MCFLYFLQVYHVMSHLIKFVILGYSKTVSHVVIGLKTAKGTKQLKLDPSIYESLQKERVEVESLERLITVQLPFNTGWRRHLWRS